MNLYPVQQSMVAELNTQFTSATLPFQAFDLPDTQNDFQKAVQNPIVYVVYTGGKAEPSRSTNVINQPRKLSFSVEIHARSLYKSNGLFVCRDIVEQILLGFAPTNCQRLYMIKDDISKTDDNIWVHIYEFECQTMLVQKDVTDPVIVPTFQAMDLKDGPTDDNPDHIIPVQS